MQVRFCNVQTLPNVSCHHGTEIYWEGYKRDGNSLLKSIFGLGKAITRTEIQTK